MPKIDAFCLFFFQQISDVQVMEYRHKGQPSAALIKSTKPRSSFS